MRMRRLTSLVLAFVTVFTMGGCQTKVAAETVAFTAEETQPIEVSEKIVSDTIAETVAEPVATTMETEEQEFLETSPAETEEARHEHTYIQSIIKKATCARPGEIKYMCSCGDMYTEEVPKEKHIYESKTVDPTCTEAGYTVYVCKGCNASYQENQIEAMDHSWGDWKVTKEATITSTGTKTRVCIICKQKETAIIEKLAHTHSYTEKVTTKATCEKEGEKTFGCICGDAYTEVISAVGHTWGDWKVSKVATEWEEGRKDRSCTACGQKESQTIPKLGHTHSMTHIVTKPTCISEGYTTHKCSTCPYSYTDTKVAARGHSFGDWITVTAPTEAVTGSAKRTCSVCGTSETKVLEKLPPVHVHSFSITETVSAGCTSAGYVKKSCSCGAEITETIPASHQWEKHHEDEVGHWVVYIVCHCGWRCSAEGDYITAFANHVNSVDIETRYDHSYYDVGEWIVDIPAKNWTECVECGAIQ